jgi:hypothetical protein
MWESRSFLTTERFSFTAYGTPLQNHWWLSQLAFYAAYAAGGPLLLTLFAGACALAAVYGSWRLMRGALEVRVVLLAFLVLATAPEWAVRPQVISLALLVVSAHLIARDRIVWLPLVCLVWGNAHAMVIFGVLMAGACALEALCWTRERFLRDAAVTLACVLAPMLSPLGVAYWPRVLSTVSMSKTLQLQEYMPPLEAADLPFWIAVAALAALVFLRRANLSARSRADRILLLASAGLAVAGATAGRNVAFFAVLAAPVLSWLWADAPVRRRERPLGALGYTLLALAVVVAGVVVVAQRRGGGARLGWTPISEEIVSALERCEGPTFNHLEDGGYLMWSRPQRRVMVDSRMEAYPLPLLRLSRSADLSGEYEDLFREYGITCALVKTDSLLERRLVADNALTVVFRDSARSVLARVR